MDPFFLLSINSLFNSILMLNQHNIAAIASVFHQPVSILAVIPIQQAYTPLTILLSLISGAIVGFSLGLIGGGGSILAVPLLLYVVGITDAHIAIGTSALAVGVNALTNIVHHYKRGYVKIKEGLRFAIPGVAGTILGSQLGLLTPSNSLLILFGIFMIIISVRMLRQSTNVRDIKIKNSTTALIAKDSVSIIENNPNDDTEKNNKCNNVMNNHSKDEDRGTDVLADDSNLYNKNANTNKLLKLLTTGFLVGLAAGYFGIGGGFIIVPSLMHLGLNIINAIGTSLIPVSMFGFSTAIRYSFNNQIEWVIALLFISGGIGGGILGTRFASKLPKKTLSMAFAFLLIIVAVYIISKSVLLIV
jgi:uncharacterized membrane protein YfcA